MNITTLEPKASSYEFHHLGRTTKLSFDEKNLSVIAESKCTQRTQTVPLDYLDHNFIEETTMDPDAIKYVRLSYLLVASSVILFFSDYQDRIPLLSPALLIYGVLTFYFNFKRAKPYRWITVASVYSRDLFSIRTVDPVEEVMDRARLKAFLNGLEKAIRESKP